MRPYLTVHSRPLPVNTHLSARYPHSCTTSHLSAYCRRCGRQKCDPSVRFAYLQLLRSRLRLRLTLTFQAMALPLPRTARRPSQRVSIGQRPASDADFRSPDAPPGIRSPATPRQNAFTGVRHRHIHAQNHPFGAKNLVRYFFPFFRFTGITYVENPAEG